MASTNSMSRFETEVLTRPENLEERRVLYAIRLPSNEVLQWEIQHLLTRPVGRPPKQPIIWWAIRYAAAQGC